MEPATFGSLPKHGWGGLWRWKAGGVFRLGLSGGGNGPTPGFPPVVAEGAVLRGGGSGAGVSG